MILTNWNKKNSRVSALDKLKQKIIVPINHRETVEYLIEQNVDLFAAKDTD